MSRGFFVKGLNLYLLQLVPQQLPQDVPQEQSLQPQSLQQQDEVLLSFVFVALLTAYTEALASIIAAAAPIITFFIFSKLNCF
jgi:hypothetical protein